MKTIVICGSMRFTEQMIKTAYDWEMNKGVAMICPTIIPKGETYESGKETSASALFDKTHKRKIDMCDAIYVMNVGGYIGNSTRGEIEYATKHGKEIIYHEPKQ